MTRRSVTTALVVVVLVSGFGLWVGARREATSGATPSRCTVLTSTGTSTGGSPDDIRRTVCQLRESGFVLGNELSPITSTPNRPGAMQHFQYVSLYWSPATGVGWVMGSIRDKWGATNWENGVLGFPRTGEVGAPDGRGRFTHFEGGSIYWTPQTGAHEVHGAIHTTWAAYGWERPGGPADGRTPAWALGYPVTDEVGTPDGRGRFTFFENGAIYWSPDSGAHRVYGRILDRWARDGYEATMGYPVDEPHLVQPSANANEPCVGRLAQTFVRWQDGTGGTYCEQVGFVDYLPRGVMRTPASGIWPSNTGVAATPRQPSTGVSATPKQPTSGTGSSDTGVSATPKQPATGVSATPKQPTSGTGSSDTGVSATPKQPATGVAATPKR